MLSPPFREIVEVVVKVSGLFVRVRAPDRRAALSALLKASPVGLVR